MRGLNQDDVPLYLFPISVKQGFIVTNEFRALLISN